MTDDLVGWLRKLLADAEQQRREALNHLPGDTKVMMLTNAAHAERHVLAQVPLLFARIEALEAEKAQTSARIDRAFEMGWRMATCSSDRNSLDKMKRGIAEYRTAIAKDHPHAD